MKRTTARVCVTSPCAPTWSPQTTPSSRLWWIQWIPATCRPAAAPRPNSAPSASFTSTQETTWCINSTRTWWWSPVAVGSGSGRCSDVFQSSGSPVSGDQADCRSVWWEGCTWSEYGDIKNWICAFQTHALPCSFLIPQTLLVCFPVVLLKNVSVRLPWTLQCL